jgi:hypothetical protein
MVSSMRVVRSELVEKDGSFTCAIKVPTADLPALIALLPTHGNVYEIQIGPSQSQAIPTHGLPRKLPESNTYSTADERTQIVAPPGFDVSKVAVAKGAPREIMVSLYLVRDPLFQDWVIEESKATHADIRDAVDFAAVWVAKQIGVRTLFDTAEADFPKLAAIQSRYEAWLKARTVASTAAPA